MKAAIKGMGVNKTKAFKSLFNNPTDFNLVFDSLSHTILSSFIIDKTVTGQDPKITEANVAARWAICERWFRIMRGELGWGLKRTLDEIPRALAHELLDMEYKPSKLSSYTTFDQRDLRNLIRRR